MLPQPDVVHTLNGVEYLWPAAVTIGATMGDRYVVKFFSGVFRVEYMPKSGTWGNRTHYTRAGADAQAALLNAALGVGS